MILAQAANLAACAFWPLNIFVPAAFALANLAQL